MIEILFGIIAGTIAALGMGGGSILILLLSVFTDYAHKTIQGINLIFFIPTALIAIFWNLKRKNIDLKLSGVIIFFGIIGAIIGSNIAFRLSNKTLEKYFLFFLIIITIYELYGYFKKYILMKK